MNVLNVESIIRLIHRSLIPQSAQNVNAVWNFWEMVIATPNGRKM